MSDAEVYPSAPLVVAIVEIRHPVSQPLAGAQLAAVRLALAPVTPLQRYEVPEVITGLVGVAFIGVALASSLVRNRRLAREPAPA